jgi:hypothetical protein
MVTGGEFMVWFTVSTVVSLNYASQYAERSKISFRSIEQQSPGTQLGILLPKPKQQT